MAKRVYHKTRRQYKKGAKRLGAKQVATRKEFKKVQAGLKRTYGRKYTTLRTKAVLKGLDIAGLTAKEKRALLGKR